MSELGKPSLKKQDKSEKKNKIKIQNAIFDHKTSSEKDKFGWNKK